MKKVGVKKYQISSRFTQEEVMKLHIILENKEIEDLEILQIHLQDFDQKTLKKLEDYNDLKVAYFVIKDDCIPFFVKLILGNKLTKLTLDLPNSKDCLLIFQALNDIKSIEYLYLYQKFEKEGLEKIQNIINGNTNLKSIAIQNFDYFNGVYLDPSPIIDGIQDNYSIQYFSLSPLDIKQKGVLKFNKYKALKDLKLTFNREERNYKSNSDQKISKDQSITLENPFDFSNMFIKKFDFSNSKIDHENMIYLMKSLKEVAFFEELNLSYSKVSKKNSQDHFFEWILDLKDILVNNNNLKNLNISNLLLKEKDFEILCEGFEKNDSLIYLDIEGNIIGKLAGQIGKILNSKVNLENFYIGNNNLNFNEFMKEFQFQQNLKFFYLSKCRLDNESDKLISNFLSNNMNINCLSLYVESIETTENIFKALDKHNKIKVITIDSKSSIPGKYIIDLIKKNTKIESLSFSNVIFENQELKECFEALSKDSIIISLDLPFLCHSLSDGMKIIEEYLFYNYSLKYFTIDDYKSIYCNRNKEFITNYYKIKTLKNYDLFFSFEK